MCLIYFALWDGLTVKPSYNYQKSIFFRWIPLIIMLEGNQGHSICHSPSPQHSQSPLPPHLQPCGQQRQTHLRQQLAEAECPRLQGTEAEIRPDLRRRQIPDKDRAAPP